MTLSLDTYMPEAHLKQLGQFISCLLQPLPVCAVYDEDKAICVIKVIAPACQSQVCDRIRVAGASRE